MSYEDFIEGIKPVLDSEETDDATDEKESLKYEIKDGIFKSIANLATRVSGNIERTTEIDFGSKDFYKMSLGGKHRPDGREFFVLEISGGIEMALSQATGQYYATAKKANIASTFDEQTCIALIGSEMLGNIVKVDSEAYDYTIRDTGEIITLSHRYVYEAEVAKTIPGTTASYERLLPDVKSFSMNEQQVELVC